jgi:hypothetical protein
LPGGHNEFLQQQAAIIGEQSIKRDSREFAAGFSELQQTKHISYPSPPLNVALSSNSWKPDRGYWYVLLPNRDITTDSEQ